MLILFAEGEDVMKAKEVSSQNSSKLILWAVGILIAILVLGSIISENIYQSKKSEDGEIIPSRNLRQEGSSDSVWIGTGYVGTNRGDGTLDGDNWEAFTTQYPFYKRYGDEFIGIAIDSFDRVWFAEYDEISVFDGENWETVTTPQERGWGDDYIEAFAMDSSERLWFGTETHGVSVFDGENWEKYTPRNSGLGGEWVDVISIDSSDRLWFGNENGVSVFDGENWENYTTQNSGLGSNIVTAIAFDSSDRVWFGTYRHGVSVLDGENWETYTTQNSGLGDDFVTALAIDSSDRVWVGTEQLGVSVFDGENWITYTEDNSGVLSDTVQEIVADKQGFMWIGTRRGINRVPIGEGLLSPPISPFFTSFRNLVSSPSLIWRNLLLVIVLGTIAMILSDPRRSMDEQDPTGEDKISKRRLALQGAAGGVTASAIVFLFVSTNELPSSSLDFLAGAVPYFIAILAVPVSLLLVGPVAGIYSKTKKTAYLYGLLAQLILEGLLIGAVYS